MILFVDTSVWSLAFRRATAPAVPEVAPLRQALERGDTVVTTGLVLQELLQGFSGPRAREDIVERFSALPIVVPDRQDHIDAAELLRYRERLNTLLGERGKVSVNDLVIKAAALALRRIPECNAAWIGDGIRYFHRVHVGVAVAPQNFCQPLDHLRCQLQLRLELPPRPAGDHGHVFFPDVQHRSEGQSDRVPQRMPDDQSQGDPDVSVNKLLIGRTGRRIVVNARSLYFRSVTFGRCVVQRAHPTLVVGEYFQQQQPNQTCRDRGGIVSEAGNEVIIGGEIDGDADSSKPSRDGSPPRSQHHSGHDHRQSPPRSPVKTRCQPFRPFPPVLRTFPIAIVHPWLSCSTMVRLTPERESHFSLRELGYFSPSEEEPARQLLISYWMARAALYEVVLGYRNASDIPPSLRPTRFLIAYAAAILLVDAARCLRESYHDQPAIRVKLNQADLAFGITAGRV